ncbi:MAG: hypothetical protein WAP23_01250 [Candidatus Spechtbacterales bacterium]
MARGAQSTQSFVKIDQIREGVVLLKGGGIRALLKCSSLNFSLKSQDEQDAIIFEFQNFLNSLDFYIQIFVNSRFLNIDDYIETLKAKEAEQENDLLRIQTQEYISFIKDFVASTNIVSTDFYVTIPFEISEAAGKTGGAGGLLSFLGLGKAPAKMARTQFLHYKNQLLQRVEFIRTGLHRFGLTTKILSTEELIMLYWNMYNPQNLQKRTLMKSVFEKY